MAPSFDPPQQNQTAGSLRISVWVIYGILTACFLLSCAVSKTSSVGYWVFWPRLDITWLIFSMLILHFANLQTVTPTFARKWMLVVFISALGLAFISDTPLFPTRLIAKGPQATAWAIVILSANGFLSYVFRRYERWQMAAATALLSVISIINLQQLAFVRGWWNFQYAGPEKGGMWPLWIFWGAVIFGIVFAFRTSVVQREEHRWKPVMVFLLLHLAALLTRISYG